MIAWNSKALGKPEDCILKLLDLTNELPLEAVLQDTHAGTHIEAPAYLIPSGKKLDQFAVASFMVQAVLLDLTSKKAGQPIDDEDLEGAEESAGLAVPRVRLSFFTPAGVTPAHHSHCATRLPECKWRRIS